MDQPSFPQDAKLTLGADLAWLEEGGELGKLISHHPWETTPLGALTTWPQSLRTAVSLMLSSQHPMWIGWGPTATFLYNDAYISVLSRSKHPWALGRPASVVWAEIWDICGPLAEKVFQRAEASFVDDVELFMKRSDFIEETYYSFSYSPIRDEFGAVGGLFCPSADVSAKVLNARRLATLSELATNVLLEKTVARACATAFATLRKNTKDVPFAALYLFDAAGKNLERVQAVGLLREDESIVPAKVNMSADPASRPEVFKNVLHGKSETSFQLPVTSALPDGPAAQRIAQAIILPVTVSGSERPLGYFLSGINPARLLDREYRTFFELIVGQIATAIQNARTTEEDRRRSEELAELDRAKTTFFNNVSHELRTPLTLMLGPLEELSQRGGLQKKRVDTLALAEVAHRNGLRLLKLVNTLLDFSRLEAGRLQGHFEPVNLGQYTSELASTFRSAIEHAGLSFVVDTPSETEIAYIDPNLWEKIVLNLLANALKYTLQGQISIRIGQGPETFSLEVADTGIGIPKEAQSRLFERFYRVEGSHGRTQEGTGIGLALVHDLARLHGGTIRVESEVGVGSRFIVTIPRGFRHLPEDRLTKQPARATSQISRQFTEEASQWRGRDDIVVDALDAKSDAGLADATENKGCVLLVDDNADMREYVARLLAQKFEVITATDGEAAIEVLKRRTPDLILSDVMMPRLDGFGLIRAVRAHEEWRALPVILLSARAGDEARLEGVTEGADDYLVKPFHARELLTRVSTHLELARLRRESERKVREADERFRSAVEAAGVGVWTWDIAGNRLFADEIVFRVFSYAHPENGYAPVNVLLPKINPHDLPRVQRALEQVRTGVCDVFEEDYRIAQPDGTDRWVSARGKSRIENGASVFSGVLWDITERKALEQERANLLEQERQAREEAQILSDTARALGGQLDLRITVQNATDSATKLSGAQFGAFFYNVINEREESLLLYTLSGTTEDAFSKSGLLTNSVSGDSVLKSERTVRLADITQEPGYHQVLESSATGADLPLVKSFLAVPVLSRTGEVLGGMFFGHPDANVFTERSERIALGIAAQAAVAIDNAKLYQRVQNTVDRLNFSLESLALGHWSWDVETDAIICSPRMLDIYGVKDSVNSTREAIRARLHPDDREKARAAARRSVAMKSDYDVEYRVLHPTRGLRWISAKGRPVFNSEGKMTGTMGVAQDITERKQAELHLLKQKDVLEQIVVGTGLTDILESLTAWIEEFADRKMIATVLLVDAGGKTLRFAAGKHCPPAWTEQIDGSAIALIGWATAAFRKEVIVSIDIQTDPLWADYKREVLRQGFHASCSVPIFSSAGEVLGIISVYYFESTEPTHHERDLIDVATRTASIAIERKRAEEALRESRARIERHAEELEITVAERTAKLRETIGELEAFSYSISHDMRAPLRAMHGYADLLISEFSQQLSEEGQMYLQRVSRNATRLQLLVRDVLAYSKVAKEKVQLSEVNLAQFLPLLLEQMQELQSSAATVDVTSALPVVLGHEAYLSQIFTNLLANAIKFARKGTPLRISISAAVENNIVKISIADNGIGIAPEHFERIFEIFGRVYPDKMYEGTGIGLSIVKKAIHRLGGSVGVTSQLGEGSTFWFTLRLPNH